MTPRLTAFFILFGLTTLASEAPKTEPKLCDAPKTGPVWFQDLTKDQIENLDLKWTSTEKEGSFEIRGEYKEKPKDNRTYKEFESTVSLNIRETWKCPQGEDAEFVSVSGNMETETDWELNNSEGKQEFESKDGYQVMSIQEIRQIRHKSESNLELESALLKKEEKEWTDWEQTWDESGIPYLKGKMGATSFEQKEVSGGKSLASVSKDLDFDKGIWVRIRREQSGKFDGPQDLVSLENQQEIEKWEKGQKTESESRKSTENREYKINPKKKTYDFVESTEKSVSDYAKVDQTLSWTENRITTWNDLAKAPTKVSFWKSERKKEKVGYSTQFSVSSQGHKLLPKLFGISSGDGTLTRITDFYENNNIARFLVLYFPKSAKGNETKLDFKFNQKGMLQEFVVDDGTVDLQKYKDPFNDKGAKQSMQARVDKMQSFEEAKLLSPLPEREPNETDFPAIYVVPED